MARFFAWATSCLLIATGAFLLWQGGADEVAALPAAPPARPSVSLLTATPVLPEPPEASPRSREQKRFARADKDDDGRITAAELFDPRRKAFAKLDKDSSGTLGFDEWAVRTVEKFASADADRSGWLTPVEYATTAPPAPKKKRCAC